jgi:hypothetical protein
MLYTGEIRDHREKHLPPANLVESALSDYALRRHLVGSRADDLELRMSFEIQ